MQAEGEAAVLEAYPEATIFRAGPLVGVEDHFLNNVAAQAKSLPFVPLVDGGRTRFQPVYVRDVVSAMMTSLRSRDVLGQTFHLGGPGVFTCASLIWPPLFPLFSFFFPFFWRGGSLQLLFVCQHVSKLQALNTLL